ncbi:MAG: Type secretory pathway, VirD2 component (relaxase) [Edaphobacter sp.]|nr:Type secretory pathway, VirD2 component (relaxase) [Edaphobacter sp.]
MLQLTRPVRGDVLHRPAPANEGRAGPRKNTLPQRSCHQRPSCADGVFYQLEEADGRMLLNSEDERTGALQTIFETTAGKIEIIRHDGTLRAAWRRGDLEPGTVVTIDSLRSDPSKPLSLSLETRPIVRIRRATESRVCLFSTCHALRMGIGKPNKTRKAERDSMAGRDRAQPGFDAPLLTCNDSGNLCKGGNRRQATRSRCYRRIIYREGM